MKNEVLLGQLIKEKILSLNMRMEDLAEKAGISRYTLSSIESGKSNCSIRTIFNIADILKIQISFGDYGENDLVRFRASRINSLLNKKINRFVVMCIEQYSLHTKEDSGVVYSKLSSHGIIDELQNDYEDLHGMSTPYINEYIDKLLIGGNL